MSQKIQKLAIDGGTPVVTSPVSAAQKRWGKEELVQLTEMLEQDSLFYWNGPKTNLLIQRFKQHYPLEYVMPCSSGTAALHIAVAASGIKPGEEVIVPPITDMGTVIGILYQQGVPVFADLEPHTYNFDIEDVRRKITPKTRAIIGVHLTGNPYRAEELRALADKHGIVFIEDCAQAWGAKRSGKPVGLFGHIACYSLNDFKHIGCGDGGIVASSEERFGPLLQKFGDKAYDRVHGTRDPEFLAPNYRITEPQSAVGAAQLERLDGIVTHRHKLGTLLGERLREIPGIQPQEIDAEAYSSYWFYMARFDASQFTTDRAQFVKALTAEGIAAGAGYIAMPLYQYALFRNQNFFGGEWPIRKLGLTDMDYNKVSCPVSEAILETAILFPIKTLDESGIGHIGEAVRKVALYYHK